MVACILVPVSTETAQLFFSLLAPGSRVPMVGASGAISGVLGFYFVWFPRNVVRVLLLLFPILVRVVEIPARIVLGIYLVIDNVLPMLFAGSSAGGGVAHAVASLSEGRGRCPGC